MTTIPLVLLTAVCGALAILDHSVELMLPRRLAPTPISFPTGCTGGHKPDTEPFCATGTLDFSDGLKLDITIFLFDVEDPTKSVYFHGELKLNGTTPVGLNITGGGSAKVVQKEGLAGFVDASVTLAAETVGDGTGKYDSDTGKWGVDVKLTAAAEVDAFGGTLLDPSFSEVVTAYAGPNFDFGIEGNFEKSTGDSNNQGASIALDLAITTKDNNILTWELGVEVTLHVNITVYIFDVDDPKKSVNFHIEIANNNTTPTGLNITGGGSAKVVKKEELFGAVELSVTVSAATIGDGRGKYDPSTGRYLADIKVNADAKASALDYDALDLPVSKVVTAHIGPNYDFGLEAIFKESTGDSKDAGISIAFDLTMNTKNHDLFTWDLVGEGKLHIWWKPAHIDITPTIDVFNKEFKLAL
ncbi:hypothetical protein FOL46_000082 [Perkinsus olseni]|uniref:Uncharacterized protein n=1 Tax=Perkinsus olseni TaxID=32597 RepID=A0A7J6MYB3_PEROL|nr:hypothetical protein FOL46_000082 [Perkinsus olseni]